MKDLEIYEYGGPIPSFSITGKPLEAEVVIKYNYNFLSNLLYNSPEERLDQKIRKKAKKLGSDLAKITHRKNFGFNEKSIELKVSFYKRQN